MKKKEILLICCHTGILETLTRLITQSAEFSVTPAGSSEAALSHYHTKVFDLVLLGAGLDPAEEQELEQKLKEISAETPVVYHFGGGSGLLFTEIKQALDQA